MYTEIIQAGIFIQAINVFDRISNVVPSPYLDEIFHIPQTRLYCQAAAAATGGDGPLPFTFQAYKVLLTSVPWDPKITTPPGLYILAQMYSQYIAGPVLRCFGATSEMLDPCGVLVLRSLNVGGLLLVLPVVLGGVAVRSRGLGLKLQQQLQVGEQEEVEEKETKTEEPSTLISLVSFPLLLFFGSLFYTDVWATILVLMALAVGLVDPTKTKSESYASTAIKTTRRIGSAALAALSITFRQTNILWAGYIAVTLLEEEHRSCIEARRQQASLARTKEAKTPKSFLAPSPPPPPPFTFSLRWLLDDQSPDLLKFVYTAITTPSITVPYLGVALLFALFVYTNGGSIALGDKDNHQFSLNPAQLFHFALHVVLFTGPAVFAKFHLSDYFRYCTRSHPIVAALSVVLIGLLVHHTTGPAHPFTLADNRHYTFTIWRRWIEPSRKSLPFAVLIAAPVYHTGFWLLWPREGSVVEAGTATDTADTTATTTITATTPIPSTLYTRIAYFAAVVGTLVPSPLLEPRYYMIPFIIWRTRHYKRVEGIMLPLFETAWYMIINELVVYVFLNKPFAWASEPGVLQRLMW